ncbi:YbaB/EbfC family nucleoid-associated protein [Micromonospora sp. NPDC051296]|uniref:YbaB/EbfC family nucleoid-associated protein n=1 Tax=Micromonospora sp. NPDC051296 TaxID=3155046 RepID=UPI003432AE51
MDAFDATADSAEEWTRSWAASMSERAAQAQVMSQRVADLSVSATGADGAVEVTVAGSGIVTDLRLDERLSNWPAARIATEIMATMRRAQGRLAEAVAEIAAQTVGTGSETARAVVASFAERFPELDDDREEGRRDDFRRERGGW